VLVDDDHGFRHRIQNGLDLGLPITSVFRFVQQPVTDIAEDRSKDSKQSNVDQIARISVNLFSQEEAADTQAHHGGKYRGPRAADKGGIDNHRDEDHGKGSVLEIMLEHQKNGECNQRRQSGQPVAKPDPTLPDHWKIRPTPNRTVTILLFT
jgi:hypothetical protein